MYHADDEENTTKQRIVASCANNNLPSVDPPEEDACLQDSDASSSSSSTDEKSGDDLSRSLYRSSPTGTDGAGRRRQPVRSTRLRRSHRFQPRTIYDDDDDTSSSGGSSDDDARDAATTDEDDFVASSSSSSNSMESSTSRGRRRSILQPIPATATRHRRKSSTKQSLESTKTSNATEDDRLAFSDSSNEDGPSSAQKKQAKKAAAVVIDLLDSEDDSIAQLTRHAEQLDLNSSAASDSSVHDENWQDSKPLHNYNIDASNNNNNSSTSSSSSPKVRRTPSKYAKKSNATSSTKESRAAFIRRRVALAEALFVEMDSKVFGGRFTATDPNSPLRDQPSVVLAWSKTLRTTAGRTHCCKGTGPTGVDRQQFVTYKYCKIELSTKVLDAEQRLRDTLAHELCHAAQWILDGSTNPGHGADFKRWGRRTTQAFPDISITTCHRYAIHKKFAWKCDTCAAVFQSNNRKRIDPHKHVCAKCDGGGRFVPQFGPPKPLTAYQVFVQEHRRNGRTMQETAQLWRQRK